ncbi:zinc ribbon domain-containing protein [Microcoleus sp. OTE_8_concoct_300]|uniref:zinc ribbon domain-containing protein n=1 Tax=Microcoleus sp. OTE_8_concoct_300 TaxID=2964710 RepID=UPI00403F9672
MYGTKFELVDRWYASSQTCSNCGPVQSMPLKERVFNCQHCGAIIERDLNVAINL